MKSKIIFMASMSLLCTSIYAQESSEGNLSEHERNYIESCNAEYPFAHWFTKHYSLREPGHKRDGYQRMCKHYGIDISDKIIDYDNYRNRVKNQSNTSMLSVTINESASSKLTQLYNRALELTENSPNLPHKDALTTSLAIRNAPNEKERMRLIKDAKAHMDARKKEPPRLNIPALRDFNQSNDGLPFSKIDESYPLLVASPEEVSFVISSLNENCSEREFDKVINGFHAEGYKKFSHATFKAFIDRQVKPRCAFIVLARNNDADAFTALSQIYEFAPKIAFSRTWSTDTHSPDEEISELNQLFGEIIRIREHVLWAMKIQGSDDALQFLQGREHRGTYLGDVASRALIANRLDDSLMRIHDTDNKPVWLNSNYKLPEMPIPTAP